MEISNEALRERLDEHIATTRRRIDKIESDSGDKFKMHEGRLHNHGQDVVKLKEWRVMIDELRKVSSERFNTIESQVQFNNIRLAAITATVGFAGWVIGKHGVNLF